MHGQPNPGFCKHLVVCLVECIGNSGPRKIVFGWLHYEVGCIRECNMGLIGWLIWAWCEHRDPISVCLPFLPYNRPDSSLSLSLRLLVTAHPPSSLQLPPFRALLSLSVAVA